MVAEGPNFPNILNIAFLAHFIVLLILIFYAIFALIVVRQVDLMSKALITPISPIVKAIAIIHAGFAMGFIILSLGLF